MDRLAPHLFAAHPGLAPRIPWTRLGPVETEVCELAALARRTETGPIWVKRDDRFGLSDEAAAVGPRDEIGGAKLRKLEFLLADAERRGRRSLLTFGAIGSNHVVATATCARRRGLPTVGVVMPQPPTPRTLANFALSQERCAELHRVGGPVQAALRGATAYASLVARGARPYLVPPGGSSAVGVLGYVDAAFEIAAQVGRGAMPAPDYVFVPAGSCGILAGLAVGLRLAGLTALPIGVRAYEAHSCNAVVTRNLVRGTLRLLARWAPGVARVDVRACRFAMLRRFLGAGYGHPTAEARRAVGLASEFAGLELETTYGGKALAGLLAYMGRADQRGKVALFVHTFWAPPPTAMPADTCTDPGYESAAGSP